MPKKVTTKTKINSSTRVNPYNKYVYLGIALVAITVFFYNIIAKPTDINLVGSRLGSGTKSTGGGATSTVTTTTQKNDSKTTVVETKPVPKNNSNGGDDAFAGVQLGGGASNKDVIAETMVKVVDFIESTTHVEISSSNNKSLGETGSTQNNNSKTNENGRCSDDSCVQKSNSEVFSSITMGAGVKGEDKDGNQYQKEVVNAPNALGGKTTTTTITSTDPEKQTIHQTREIVIKDSNNKEVDKTVTTFTREKNQDGTYKDQTSFSRNGKPSFETNKTAPVLKSSKVDTTLKSQQTNQGNEITKCKAGNVIVASGTWVATGNTFSGDSSQRECTQISSDCTHKGSAACHVVFAENPSQVILPISAGTEYTLGKPVSEVNSKDIPKLSANCIANGETVTSGTEREEIGVCDDGHWIEKEQYIANQLTNFEHNQTHLQDTNFGKVIIGQGQVGDSNPTSGTSRRDLINQEKTYNSLNDKVWTGISLSLGGKEITIGGGNPNSQWGFIIPAKSNSENNYDNLYSGINISWLGGDIVFGKNTKDSPTYFDIDRPTLPRSYNEGFAGGAMSCGLAPFAAAACGVVGGVVGSVNGAYRSLFIKDTQTPQSDQINLNSPDQTDTGQRSSLTQTSQKTAGSTGGFNLSKDISRDNIEIVSESQKGVQSSLPNANGKTDAEQGCGVYTSYNMLKTLGYEVDLNDLKKNYKYNCSNSNNGCTATADATLGQINGYIHNSRSYAQTNRITSANQLAQSNGYYIYGGTVNGNVSHVAGFIVNNEQILSVDSLYGSRPCVVVSENELKCGDANYHVGDTNGVPDSFYPLPVQ